MCSCNPKPVDLVAPIVKRKKFRKETTQQQFFLVRGRARAFFVSLYVYMYNGVCVYVNKKGVEKENVKKRRERGRK